MHIVNERCKFCGIFSHITLSLSIGLFSEKCKILNINMFDDIATTSGMLNLAEHVSLNLRSRIIFWFKIVDGLFSDYAHFALSALIATLHKACPFAHF